MECEIGVSRSIIDELHIYGDQIQGEVMLPEI